MNNFTSMEVMIDYTNWKGNRRCRRIKPLAIAFTGTMYHPGDQWLLKAVDLEDQNKVKYFPLKDIHSWKPYDANVPSPSNRGSSSE